MADEPNTAAAASSGLSEDAASGLAYLTVIPAIVFLIVAPYNTNPKIKFHAWQNIFLTIGWFACSVVMIIPILGWIVGVLGVLTLFVCWLIAIIQAFQGTRFVIPVIGAIAAKQAGA